MTDQTPDPIEVRVADDFSEYLVANMLDGERDGGVVSMGHGTLVATVTDLLADFLRESGWRARPVVDDDTRPQNFSELIAYMEGEGWTVTSTGPAGSYWSHPNRSSVAVPDDIGPGSYEWKGVLYRLGLPVECHRCDGSGVEPPFETLVLGAPSSTPTGDNGQFTGTALTDAEVERLTGEQR